MKVQFIASCLVIIIGAWSAEPKAAQAKHPKAIFKTCSCKLADLPALKDFLEVDLPEYGRLLEVRYEQNAVPTLYVLDENASQTASHIIEGYSRSQIREKLKELGITPYFPLEDLPVTDEL